MTIPVEHPMPQDGADRILSARRVAGLLAALFLLGIAGRALAIANTSPTAVGNMPLPDDAFYYFTLARNAAAGPWPVVSGDGGATTGFQPLWGIGLALLDRLAGGLSDLNRITVAQALGGAIGLAAGWMIYRLGRRLTTDVAPAILACGAYLLSPQILKHNLNGMETSLAILGLMVLAFVFLLFDPWQPRGGAVFFVGAACGACLLARVDLVFFFLAGLAGWTLRMVRRPTGAGGPRGFGRIGLFLLGTAAALAPWAWVSSQAGTGLLPESGNALRNLTLLLNDHPLLAFPDSLREAPQLFLRIYGGYAVEFTAAWVRQVPLLLPLTIPFFALLDLRTAELASVALAIAASLLVALAGRRDRKWLAFALWAVYAVALTAAYAAVILGPWFFQRYGAPIGIFFNLLLLVAVWRLIRGTRLAPAAFPLAAAGMALSFLALVWQGSYRWIVAGETAVPDDGFFRAAQYIDRELPDDARIGVFSAGLITYNVEQVVVALDGKVNREARLAMEDDRMFAYVCETRLDYVVDWEKMIRHLLAQRSVGWREGNLSEVAVIQVADGNDILVQAVNRANCPAP